MLPLTGYIELCYLYCTQNGQSQCNKVNIETKWELVIPKVPNMQIVGIANSADPDK